MKAAQNVSIASIYILAALSGCSSPAKKAELPLLDDYIQSATRFFESGEIDSSLHYIDLCYGIENDYAPARHLEGKIYLYKDGIYNRRLSASALKKAVRAEDDNPEYHYSLGVTLEQQGYFQNALQEYQTAAGLDSSDYRPLERIAEINRLIGLRYDDRKYFQRSLEASNAAAALTEDPEYYYQQGAALYQMRDYQSSSEVIEKGIRLCREPVEASALLLLLGADLVLIGKHDSAGAVFERARGGMTDLAWSDLEDPRYVMTPAEYEQYQYESNYNQGRTKREAWARLDPNPTTAVNERQLEHFARFIHAQLTFSLPNKSIEGRRTKRGEMYIRYGRPTSMDYVLGTGGDADAPKWVWRYDQFPQPVTLIFEDTFLNGDFDFPYPRKEWTAADYDRDPARLAAMLQSSIPQTFAYEPGTGPLEYFYMPRQFKASRGKTDLEIFAAIPYPQLSFDRDGESALAEVEWRQVLRYGSWKIADSAGVNRNYRIRASQVDNPNLSVADRLSLTAYPDTLLFAISIHDPRSGHTGIDSRQIGLRDFFTGKVEVSDMVLARRIDSPPDNRRHERKDLLIISNLDNRYFIGEPVWLYFEIYNLKKDDNGRTSYTLKQTVRENKPGGLLAGIRGIVQSGTYQEISVSYSGASIYSDENRILTIDVSKLEPGEYAISIEVTDENSGLVSGTTEDVVLYR